ncbi:hypothetical protein [Dokdonella sp.]|uniref:hypothetical protein n=1 Tax=Dokdonella sp. TaxID=2291710 RepID=UPI001B1D34D4|nr:hypothetical protein [Dokdonella sp.]MBO9664574.1 hypothetical protein [Dokdonella sp.]
MATTNFEHRHEAAIMDDRKSQWVGGFRFANHRRAPTKPDVREKRGHGWPLLDPPKLPATTTFENRHEAAIMDDRKS